MFFDLVFPYKVTTVYTWFPYKVTTVYTRFSFLETRKSREWLDSTWTIM